MLENKNKGRKATAAVMYTDEILYEHLPCTPSHNNRKQNLTETLEAGNTLDRQAHTDKLLTKS
jgi:hypothetical protein